MDKVSIMRMAMGAIEERVDYEMDRVIANIIDQNTKATGKRKVTITLELVPDEYRQVIAVSASAKAALVPTNAVTTSLYVSSARSTGELLVQEIPPQVPGQLALGGGEQEEPKLLRLGSDLVKL